MEIVGLKQLQMKLKALITEAKRQTTPSVVVGYTAAYAIYVHENVEMKWKGVLRRTKNRRLKGTFWGPHGQAKFLEQPARENQDELGRIVIGATRSTGNIRDGLLLAGLRLQRLSQDKVPILTGNLRASAFTRVESHS